MQPACPFAVVLAPHRPRRHLERGAEHAGAPPWAHLDCGSLKACVEHTWIVCCACISLLTVPACAVHACACCAAACAGCKLQGLRSGANAETCSCCTHPSLTTTCCPPQPQHTERFPTPSRLQAYCVLVERAAVSAWNKSSEPTASASSGTHTERHNMAAAMHPSASYPASYAPVHTDVHDIEKAVGNEAAFDGHALQRAGFVR
jgi:hypothetical protein